MPRENFVIANYHKEMLRQLSEQTGTTMSEWLRRFIDYGCKPQSLNEIIPAMSGCIHFSIKVN